MIFCTKYFYVFDVVDILLLHGVSIACLDCSSCIFVNLLTFSRRFSRDVGVSWSNCRIRCHPGEVRSRRSSRELVSPFRSISWNLPSPSLPCAVVTIAVLCRRHRHRHRHQPMSATREDSFTETLSFYGPPSLPWPHYSRLRPTLS